MAQIAGGTNYDWDWHYKWKAALGVLRELANAWALGKEFTASEGLAVLLRGLATEPGFSTLPDPSPLRIRVVHARSVRMELRRLSPRAANDEIEVAATLLTEYVESVRVAWASAPLHPDETAVLQSIVGFLFSFGLSPRPPVKGSW